MRIGALAGLASFGLGEGMFDPGEVDVPRPALEVVQTRFARAGPLRDALDEARDGGLVWQIRRVDRPRPDFGGEHALDRSGDAGQCRLGLCRQR